MRVVGLLLDSCERVLPLLRSPALSERWTQQSALDQWSNAGLAGHLAVSVGLEPALFSDPAVDLVVGTLCRISRKRHGDLVVIRSLSRPERAPAHGISAF